MIGQLAWEKRGHGRAHQAELYGLKVLRVWADPEGWWGERRLRRAGRSLRRWGALRALVPAEFARWDLLEQEGVTGIDPAPFLKAQGARLTLRYLERQGTAPDRATVALVGNRADRDMMRVATELCPKVRHLVIAAPRGGRELAEWLRWEFGVPILPQEEPAQANVWFSPGQVQRAEERLELYGTTPSLGGMAVWAPALAQEDCGQLPLLTALWENGKLGAEGVKIT
ncbi:MAG: hypothetical protein ACOX7N_03960 [Lawsonibacter sp.]